MLNINDIHGNRNCVVEFVTFSKFIGISTKVNGLEKSVKKRKKKTNLKNAIHNKNTCDYNDGRLSTEQSSN